MLCLYEPRDKKLSLLIVQNHGTAFYHQHGWKYYHLFTSLLLKRLHSKKQEGKDWSRISTKKGRLLYGRAGSAGKQVWVHMLIRRDMCAWGILKHHTTQEAETRRVSRYKMLDERWAAGFQRADVAVPRALQPAAAKPVKAKGVHGKLQAILRNDVSIDYAAAIAFAEQARGTMKLKDKAIDWKYLTQTGDWLKFRHRVVTDEIFSMWLYHIDRLKHRILRFKHDPTTLRDFTLVTATPAPVRAFVTINGKRVVGCDVSCAQPLLFTKLVMDYCEQVGKDELPPDVELWQQKCEAKEENDSLYPYLHDVMIRHGVTLNCQMSVCPHTKQKTYSTVYTKAFKIEFFAGIFFDKDKKSKMREVFAAYFPTVSDAITHYKQDEKVKLPVRLQRMEAQVLLEQVCPALLAQKIKVVSVHDELLCRPEHAVAVAAEIRKAFLLTHGLCPVIKIK